MVTSLLDVITRAANHTYLSWLCFCCRGTIKRSIIWISDILARFLEALFKSNRGSQLSSTTSGVIVFFYQTSNGGRSIAWTTSSLSKVITVCDARASSRGLWGRGVPPSSFVEQTNAHSSSKPQQIHLIISTDSPQSLYFSKIWTYVGTGWTGLASRDNIYQITTAHSLTSTQHLKNKVIFSAMSIFCPFYCELRSIKFIFWSIQSFIAPSEAKQLHPPVGGTKEMSLKLLEGQAYKN